jgi:hypothetical protein
MWWPWEVRALLGFYLRVWHSSVELGTASQLRKLGTYKYETCFDRRVKGPCPFEVCNKHMVACRVQAGGSREVNAEPRQNVFCN